MQDGAAQTLLTQLPDVQSPGTLQAALGAHFMQEPPQSLSVSFPSIIPSVHEGATQLPVTQTKSA